MGLLDGGIKSIVGNALKGVFLDFVITQTALTTPSDTPWEPVENESPEPETEFPCKAIVTSYKYYNIDGESVKSEDRKIVILAKDLSIVPTIGDKIKGDSEAKEYEIISPVTKDPAGATYVCHAR